MKRQKHYNNSLQLCFLGNCIFFHNKNFFNQQSNQGQNCWFMGSDGDSNSVWIFSLDGNIIDTMEVNF
jgi:hypothetical protein